MTDEPFMTTNPFLPMFLFMVVMSIIMALVKIRAAYYPLYRYKITQVGETSFMVEEINRDGSSNGQVVNSRKEAHEWIQWRKKDRENRKKWAKEAEWIE